jgi:hypothetical protein
MKANEIYRSLSSEPHWATKSKSVRWLASRYYAGVDTLEQLWNTTKPRPVSWSKYNGDFVMPPELTESDVREIVQLR